MADVKYIKIGNTNCNIVDSDARNSINSINSNLTKTTSTVNSIKFTKYGNVVEIDIDNVGSYDINNTTIPVNYRPINSVILDCMVFDGTYYFIGYLIINPNGSFNTYFWYTDFTVKQVSDNNYKFIGNITYIN